MNKYLWAAVAIVVIIGLYIWLRPEASTPTSQPVQSELVGTSWEWEYALYNDGREVRPDEPGSFVLTFAGDGRFSAKTDCNTMGGAYVADQVGVTFNSIVSTLMFCEGSQETEFVQLLEGTGGHHFGPEGELILDLKFDSGSAVFRPK